MSKDAPLMLLENRVKFSSWKLIIHKSNCKKKKVIAFFLGTAVFHSTVYDLNHEE